MYHFASKIIGTIWLGKSITILYFNDSYLSSERSCAYYMPYLLHIISHRNIKWLMMPHAPYSGIFLVQKLKLVALMPVSLSRIYLTFGPEIPETGPATILLILIGFFNVHLGYPICTLYKVVAFK